MQWFRNLRTFTKLSVGFGLVICGIVVIGLVSVNDLSRNHDFVKSIYETKFPLYRAADDIEIAVDELEEEALGFVARSHPEQMFDFKSRATQVTSAGSDVVIQLAKLANGTIYANDAEQIGASFERWRNGAMSMFEGTDAAAKVMVRFEQNRENSSELAKKLDSFRAVLKQGEDSDYAGATEGFFAARRQMFLTLFVVVVLGAMLAYYISRLLSVPMHEAVRVLRSLAERDFTVRMGVASNDELGQIAVSLNGAAENMQRALGEVQTVSGGLLHASDDLAVASERIAQGAQEQAASLEESAANIEEITATIRQSADSARQASQLALGSRETAERGGAVVEQAVSAMAEINRASKKIADIIVTIDEIAFQTNLLALNAAVEAARAGEQGRGFAVVASEVRTLAQRSATAAKEIKVLIQDSVAKVESGSELVNRSGETLREIVASARRVTDIVDEMASAAKEQSSGIDQVNKAVSQMDNVTQASAAQTDQMSSTARGLSERAGQLRALVRQFNIGRTESVPAPARVPVAQIVAPPALKQRFPVPETLSSSRITKGRAEDTREQSMDEFMTTANHVSSDEFIEA